MADGDQINGALSNGAANGGMGGPPMGPSAPNRGIGGPGGSVSVNVQLPDGKEVSMHPDGSVEIFSPAVHTHRWDDADTFGENLAERMSEQDLSTIASDQIEGVESDEQSRTEIVEQYEKGIDLLGLKIEDVVSGSGSPGRSISRVGHPLLLETMIKYHTSAEGEMLPAEGPAKIMTIGEVTTQEQQLAADFQSDFNYYLTEIATEYYPDTSKMLMELAFSGNVYKKVFRDPMRQRPVSEAITMLDMIVSEQATDLQNAIRVTHQIEMTRSQLRRMQVSGAYLDVNLGWSQNTDATPGRQATRRMGGLSQQQTRPQDLPYILWETDSDLDVADLDIDGKFERAAPDGMPLPYKVTVDKASRQVLGVWRNWRDGDPLYHKRSMYVHYGLVPPAALRFHHWGFMQILGNQTRVQRAIWRLLVDAGMFSVFPGGARLRGARAATNEIQPAPGEWVDIDVPAGVTDIRSALMAMPYKQLDAVYVQFAQMIEGAAKELAGTVTMESGEGRTNIPVGTMMSMVEQQTQIMAGVHRRTHRAQREELQKLRELFVENPKDLTRMSRNPARDQWVAAEFQDLNLVPASDPNIPSQVHRIQLAVALATIMQMAPQMFDQREVLTRLLRTVRIPQIDTLLITPEQEAQQSQAMAGMGQDPSKMAGIQLRKEISDKQLQQKTEQAQADQQQQGQDRAAHAQSAVMESQDREKDRESQERIAGMEQETERLRLNAEVGRDERKMQHEREQGLQEQQRANQEAAQDAQNAAQEHAMHTEQMQQEHQQSAQQMQHEQSMDHAQSQREERNQQQQHAMQQEQHAQQAQQPQGQPQGQQGTQPNKTEPRKFGPGSF